VLEQAGISINEVESLYIAVADDAKQVDPLEYWNELVEFVSVEKKNKLKGPALLAQSFYAMARMLNLFYADITGKELYPFMDESPEDTDSFYGPGVSQNEMKYLEYLTNEFHLNPKPKLLLVVEGPGEFGQFPRLAKELLGRPFHRLAIDIVNLDGVGNFSSKKGVERFIDDNHHRQTLVFFVLDNEGQVANIKARLLKAQSKYGISRRVTSDEYFHIWKKNIEFDNFSHEEIARAMTELCEERYKFQAEEVADCEARYGRGAGDPLSKLYEEKLSYDLDKPELLRILFGYIIAHPEKEFDAGKAKRPVVEVIQKVLSLAAMNFQPGSYETWEKTQRSGYLGEVE
jgi:hypothetical protein